MAQGEGTGSRLGDREVWVRGPGSGGLSCSGWPKAGACIGAQLTQPWGREGAHV